MPYYQYQGSPDVFNESGQYVSKTQADAIPGFFGQVQQVNSVRPDVKAAGDFATVSNKNIPANLLTGGKIMGIKNPDPIDTATAAVNGYTSLINGVPSETRKTYDETVSKVNSMLPDLAGRGAAQLAAENAQGVGTLRNEVADVNAQILQKTAEYNQLNQSIEGKPITMQSIIGEQAQVKKAAASEIGLLQAVSLGKQGMLQAAQSAADRAVDLKYDDITTQIDIRMKQLQLLEGTLSREEKTRADALNLYLQDQKDAVDEQKASAKSFQTDKINALQNGMPTSVAAQVQALYDSGRSDEANSILGRYLKKASTGATDEEKTVDKFLASLSEWDLVGTREQFMRRLQTRYPDIDPNSISDYVYSTYPDGYDK